MEQDEQGAASRASDQAVQQRRYDVVLAQLQHHLLAGTQFKKDHRDTIRKAIELRRATADALAKSDADEAGGYLSQLEAILPELPKLDPAQHRDLSDQLDRAVAWFNGDMAATVPPVLPEPKKQKKPLVANRPAAKGKREPGPDAPESAVPEPDAPRRRPTRWLRRIAAIMLIGVVISGLRATDRRADLADALALEALFDIRSVEQAQLWFQRACWIDAAIQSLGYATTDALALGQSSVEFVSSLTGDSDAPVVVEASIAEPSPEAQAEEAVAALVEQQRIEDEVERQAAVTPKTDVPTIPAPDPVLEPPLVKPEHVVRLEAQIVEMRHVIQAQDAQLASTGAQLDALGQELNLALARLASAKRDISSEAAQLVALKAERGFLDLRIQELEAENTRLLSSSPAKIPDPEITTPNPPTHRVNRSQINARQGPGTGFGIITTLTRNTPISLVEVSDGWGKFKLLQGQSAGALVWISLSLVKAAE